MSRPVSRIRLLVSRERTGCQTPKRLKSGVGSKTSDDSEPKEYNSSEEEIRFNPLGIQMISSGLRKQLFGNTVDKSVDKRKISQIMRQLKSHGLNPKKTKQSHHLNDFDIYRLIPKLLSKDLSEHFQLLGQKLSKDYKRLALNLVDRQIPEPPEKWEFSEGWTRYRRDPQNSVIAEKVEFPLENELVFDVEVCMRDGLKPTLATAASPEAWYSWCSHRLLNAKGNTKAKEQFSATMDQKDLIPMGRATDADKLIVGHNVSFDRSYVAEQYDIRCDRTRFADTMSLHMCVSGLTQHQRTLHYSQKVKQMNETNGETSDGLTAHLWSGVGSLNNLVDVYHLYCDDQQVISKDPRNVFISGSISDVLENFQELVTYCATDVKLTHQIFKTIFPMFLDRFPHPITFAGMLEMSSMYLPVSPLNWNRYISECETIYRDRERQLNLSLREVADNACSLATSYQYKDDVWLWDLDWSTQSIRLKKARPEKKKKAMANTLSASDSNNAKSTESDQESIMNRILATECQLMKVQPLLPGYPKWYTEFCSKLKYDFDSEDQPTKEDLEWEFGPYLISTRMRSVPKLMRLLWNGFPLHYDEKHGWGYLTPDDTQLDLPDRVPGTVDHNKNTIYFPLKQFKELIGNRKIRDKTFDSLDFEFVQKDLETIELQNKLESKKGFDDVIKGCIFYRLPHKGGPDKRVGNPLSKDFLRRVEDGSLSALDPLLINAVLQQSKSLSYWKNASNRVQTQIVVSTDGSDQMRGAILPRVIVAGTVTRRAVEQTWLTASNAVSDRIGSELKSIIQCPDGYHYVGADVDSQELWIASLIGDANYSGIHGSTGIGWMTLEGNKAQGTDMHSQTAKSIHVSRDLAKVLNYARIYGSGQPFASRFLMESNPNLSADEAKEKAKTIFTKTKGLRRLTKIAEHSGDSAHRRLWTGGTESDMFNKLEEIAQSARPTTPVLGCRISRALEPSVVRDNYMTSRINWVVQSSAVDFLHIMLVTMKWLLAEMRIEGRFSISIHDELRYLVASEDRYRAALALQISNLLTRSLFANTLGFNDLPLSVAFFTTVDIDKCLRKEVFLDSRTPSNPLGLLNGYGIPFGESLDMSELVAKLSRESSPDQTITS